MAALHEALRRELAKRVIGAREVAEQGATAALARLAVAEREPHGHLTPDERVLRTRLRARARALGDQLRSTGVQDIAHLTEEVAYEQWHRMLFARFLAENRLLVHPEHRVPVTLAECEELAVEEGAEDRWVLASRYAARMLPQIFRLDDPALAVAFAPEHRIALERLLEELAPEVFRADDSLGWVYQFWQAKRKDEVNAAGEPITGETLPAVTQLFTEPYMVSFLLENTIGAWWAARHPQELPPVAMPYLRRLEDGTPAVGKFDGWPATWREFTLLDPCCGSGHFLVAALRLAVPLRMQDEGLDLASAVDAVLRENLHGLELDARCTQIAAFAIALAAWTTPGATGYRPLPELQIACSGLAVGAKRDEWVALAEGDARLGAALGRLHDLFKLAPELGSLIDPTKGRADLLTASFADVQPLLARALASERVRRDEECEATAVVAQGVARAAALLACRYTLIATNVPYLARGRQDERLREFCEEQYPRSKNDLATVFLERTLSGCRPGGVTALVIPQNWLFLGSYKHLRTHTLTTDTYRIIARLGAGAFGSISGEVVSVVLMAVSSEKPSESHQMVAIDAANARSVQGKAEMLCAAAASSIRQSQQLRNPDARIDLVESSSKPLLGKYASVHAGICSGDYVRFGRTFWEVPARNGRWTFQQGATEHSVEYAGREAVFLWEQGAGEYAGFVATLDGRLGGAWKRGQDAWGRKGIAIRQMGDLAATLYTGDLFDNTVAVMIPRDERILPALWAFVKSPNFVAAVRSVNPKLNVDVRYFEHVPFDLEYWADISSRELPLGLPSPHSDDPTQWLFGGGIASSASPLQVAVARLLGYRWPEQLADGRLDALADTDGVVCLPAVRGEPPAADRLQALLAVAYGANWSPGTRDQLLADVGFAGKTLDQWLRDGFFAQHCTLFHQRPFIWHVSDGQKDGFSALVNYHKLTRGTLESLTYTYLGDWITRQEEAGKRDERGADVRLAKAKELQQKLQLILAGEPPYDVFVRWKAAHEQPIGWEPDLDDGVRVNIGPFVQAGILRAKVNVNWKKDRGKNPAGSPWGEDRYNRYEDIPRDERPAALRDVEHLTTDVKRRLRAEAAAPSGGVARPVVAKR